MNSRELVLAAMARRRCDRVPLDLGGTESSGLTGLAWRRLTGFLGLDRGPGPRIVDPYQQVTLLDAGLRQRMHADTVALFIEPREWIPGQLGDGSACLMPGRWRERLTPEGTREALGADGRVFARMPRGGFYFDPAGAPLADCASVADIEKHSAAVEACDLPAYCDEPVEATAARAKRLHAGTDAAVVFNFCCHLLHAGAGLRGYEQFLCDLAAEPEMAEALLEMLLEAYCRRIDRYAPRLRGSVDVVLFNDDLGAQSGPLVSPETYRRLIKPRQARLFSYARKAFAAPILFHSCGAISEFIPDLAEAGVDAVNPVQVSAEGMDSRRLAREFGRMVCFWGGGCDTQRVLVRGTPAEVREEVRRRIDDFRGGGFVFTQVHNVQADVPPENLVAAFEAAREFGG